MSIRALYRATHGVLYAVQDSRLYALDSSFNVTLAGTLLTSTGPVSMVDNGVDMLIVDGSTYGYTYKLLTGVFSYISDPAFYGGDRVDVLDGYFVLNSPGTNQFYLSRNIDVTFDPLYIAATVAGDQVKAVIVSRRELWVLGELRTCIYTDVGAADFPLQAIGGSIEHGCAAAHSVRVADGAVLWLSKDRDGKGIVMRGDGYTARRVSTHAIEGQFQTYAQIEDATAFVYQQRGHTIYALSFPTDGHTWCYDLATQHWHEWQSSGGRHRAQCHASAYGQNIVGDYATGTIYALDQNTYTDDGLAIQRTRSFPHLMSNARRVIYASLIADMQTGTAAPGATEPVLTVRYSDDRGATFTGTQTIGMGLSGKALTSLKFQRLGMARDRIFELSWSAPVATVLQGAWIETREAAS